MLKQVSKVVLLVALLSALVLSSTPTFAGKGCKCVTNKPPHGGNPGGCQNNKYGQCVNTNCDGFCSFF